MTQMKKMKVNKNVDEADTIFELTTLKICNNSSLQNYGAMELGNLRNQNNERKNGPWRLISKVDKVDMPNNDQVVDMIAIFPSTLTRSDGIDEIFFDFIKVKNSLETGSYILSREK